MSSQECSQTLSNSCAKISLEESIHLVKDLYGLEAKQSSCKQLVGYDDRNFYIKGILANSNKNTADSKTVQEFVFKVINGIDSKDPGILEAQTSMMNHLRKNGINCQSSVQSLKGKYIECVKLPLLEKGSEEFEKQCDQATPEQTWHCVRLNNYIPGVLFSSVQSSYCSELFYDVGKYLGKVHNAMQGFSNEDLKKRKFIWDLKNVLDVQQYTYVLKNKRQEEIASHFLKRISAEFLPALAKLPLVFLHGDINENNLLVEKDGDGYHVSGVLDFGDITYSYRLFDPAIAATYMMTEHFPNDIIDSSGHTLAGYQSVQPLSQIELSLVPLAMAGRLLTSVILGLHSYSENLGNEYLLLTQEAGWDVLEILLKTPDEEILKRWEKIFFLKNLEWPYNS